jgi:dihydrofolate reductase
MPRRIIGAAFLSLDGVMQAPGGPEEDPTGGFALGGWLAGFFDEGLGSQVDTVFREPLGLLLGRRTYDIFAAHWPYQPAGDPLAEQLNRMPKYVLTRSSAALGWADSHKLADMDALAALKEEEGPDLLIQGSSTLYPQLLGRGLLDRLVLMTAPAVIGGGKRLFGDGTPPRAFKLVEHRVTASGNTLATYDVAGAIETGSFAMADPSPVELERRERIARGVW